MTSRSHIATWLLGPLSGAMTSVLPGRMHKAGAMIVVSRNGADMHDADTRSDQAHVLVGNWWALVGTVLYLSEWVVIVAAPPPGPFGPAHPASSVMSDYAQHAGAATFSAAWFSVVLVGRVLFVAGLKASLRGRPTTRPLLDLALGAMAISVVMEIVGYGIAAGTARYTADGGSVGVVGVVAGLDSAAFWLILLIFGPIGVSVFACGLAMLGSGLFPAWLPWLALTAGLAGIVGGLMAGASTDGTGLSEPVTTIAALGMWVWMIGTSVVLVRRRPR